MEGIVRHGWLAIPGVQTGDRTLEDQLKGLGPLLAEVKGKTVCDLGCAEGLIGLELLNHGAASLYGCDVIEGNIAEARRQAAARTGCRFQCIDIERLVEQEENSAELWRYDIVLALAIFHKLKDPTRAALFVGSVTGDLAVVRLPPATAPVVIDARSGNRPHDIRKALEQRGLVLERVERGHLDEWTGYFRRA